MKFERHIIKDPIVDVMHRHGDDIIEAPAFQAMKDYVQHTNSNAFAHSIAVTLEALRYAKENEIPVDERALVRGCLLHDYWLYDCHKKGHPSFHLSLHGLRAAKNAKRDFGIGPLEADMISNHMWPIHPFRFPLCMEGWILIIADKKVSIRERFSSKKKIESN